MQKTYGSKYMSMKMVILNGKYGTVGDLMKREEVVKGLKSWLGEPGERYFQWCIDTHGEICCVYNEHGIPHPVHLCEGMQVRNFLRTTDYCKNKDTHWLDDNWAILVQEALNL